MQSTMLVILFLFAKVSRFHVCGVTFMTWRMFQISQNLAWESSQAMKHLKIFTRNSKIPRKDIPHIFQPNDS